MEKFKYYKRGQGELDTSNFPTILVDRKVSLEVLDEKAFFSLLCLNEYVKETMPYLRIRAYIDGYVSHMRSDKDLFSPLTMYKYLDRIYLRPKQIQHTETEEVSFPELTKGELLKNLPNPTPWYTLFVGADSSVEKFFPMVDVQASKVRENGKVVSLAFNWDHTKSVAKRLIIVDDILGGGATVQMLVDKIKASGYQGQISLWVQYNEGIHSPEFLDQFTSYYLGDDI